MLVVLLTLWSAKPQSEQTAVQSSSAAQGSSPEEYSADLALSQEVLDTVRYVDCFDFLLAITLSSCISVQPSCRSTLHTHPVMALSIMSYLCMPATQSACLLHLDGNTVSISIMSFRSLPPLGSHMFCDVHIYSACEADIHRCCRCNQTQCCPCRYWLQYQRQSCPESMASSSPDQATGCVLSGLASALHTTSTVLAPAKASSSTPKATKQGLRCAAQTLLPELCRLVEAQGCYANTAASVTTLVLTAGLLLPSDWAPVMSRHLQLVTCMAQAVQSTALAKQHQPNSSQQQLRQATAARSEATDLLESADGELEGSSEGALLALALHLAQTPLGAQMLLEQGVTAFIPALAKWLLSPDSGGDNLLDQPIGSSAVQALRVLTVSLPTVVP